MQTIYLLCGVPASGKTWVSERVGDKFAHVEHDYYTHDAIVKAAYIQAHEGCKPVLVDCPFNERRLRERLELFRLLVVPLFIVEGPSTIADRYYKREGKWPASNILTRAETIMEKVREWNAFHGTSAQVLEYLKGI